LKEAERSRSRQCKVQNQSDHHRRQAEKRVGQDDEQPPSREKKTASAAPSGSPIAAAIAVAARLTPIESPTIPRKSPKVPHPQLAGLLLHADQWLSIARLTAAGGSIRAGPLFMIGINRIREKEKSRARLASPQPRPTSPVNGAGGDNRLPR